MNILNDTGLTYLLGKIKSAFVKTTDTVEVSGVDVDSTPTANSSNLVTSGGVSTALGGKQDKTPIITPTNTTDVTLPITALACAIDNYYRIDVAVETLAVTLPAMTDLTTVRTVVLYLTGGTTPSVTITSADSKDVYYQDGFEIEAGNTYEINALFNGSAWIVAAVKIVVPEAEEEGGE